jgi:hypothetical protein
VQCLCWRGAPGELVHRPVSHRLCVYTIQQRSPLVQLAAAIYQGVITMSQTFKL